MNTDNDLRVVQLLSNASVAIGMSFLPLLFESKGLSNFEIGIIAIPFSAFLILSNTIFGRLSDTKGRRPFLLLGLLTSTLAMFIYIFPVSFDQFIAVRIFHGISLGIYPAALTGIASDRKVKLGNLSSFASLGWATGALLGGIIASFTSLDIIFVFSSLIFLSSFLIAYFLNTGVDSDRINGIERRLIPSNAYSVSIKKNYKEYALIIFRHGTANSIWVYWALYLKNDLGLDLASIGVVQVINMGTQFILMKKFTDRYAPRKMLLFGGIISAIAFFSFTYASNFLHIASLQVILGISWAFFFVGGLRSVEENSREDDVVSTATGLFNASLSIAQIVGPILAVIFYSIAGNYTFAMVVAGWVTLISSIIYAVLIKDELID